MILGCYVIVQFQGSNFEELFKMKQFTDHATIPSTAIYRAALVSSTIGDRIVGSLSTAGLITPQETPTGRKNFTPHDGEILFDTLVNGL